MCVAVGHAMGTEVRVPHAEAALACGGEVIEALLSVWRQHPGGREFPVDDVQFGPRRCPDGDSLGVRHEEDVDGSSVVVKVDDGADVAAVEGLHLLTDGHVERGALGSFGHR